jgi:hypothetical protein
MMATMKWVENSNILFLLQGDDGEDEVDTPMNNSFAKIDKKSILEF